ncbi:right-handed parallel beta-helix repeat-containing protein [Echinicola shivajiensis]|uniref:hypothetical protein n=1 Tax=Echinicola shivajiensis TaxID=1035916 RepID=UPI001BFC3B78|nr:hypothetical protein [Echinicola shivajiensis]
MSLSLEYTNQRASNFKFDLSNNIHFGDTIYVDPPTGLFEQDREHITSKLKQSKPGDVILFAAGTYRIGPVIDIDVPEIILLGDEKGTVIRGCEPDGFIEHAQSVIECGGFQLIADSLTIRNFIFEYTWHGIYIGCCIPADMEEFDSGLNMKTESYGGHIIESNTFRYNSTGLRATGVSHKPSKVSNNIFIDNYHGLTINGGNVTVEGNQFYSREPEKVPLDGEVHNAILVAPFNMFLPPFIEYENDADCNNNYILNNYIENIPDDIRIIDSKPDEIPEEEECGTTLVQGNKTVN